MICTKCAALLTESDTFCPGCGKITGVKARRLFKISSRLSTISLIAFFTSYIFLGLVSQASQNNGWPEGRAVFDATSWIPGVAMFGGLTGLVYYFLGLGTKQYKKLSKKEVRSRGL